MSIKNLIDFFEKNLPFEDIAIGKYFYLRGNDLNGSEMIFLYQRTSETRCMFIRTVVFGKDSEIIKIEEKYISLPYGLLRRNKKYLY